MKVIGITFLMVGVQRGGTSWVDNALRLHPEVFVPPQKQTYFFDRHYERGIDWYLSHFEGVQADQLAIGEVATGYCLPEASARMAEHLPDSSLVMSLRHPVERAFSNYLKRRELKGWTTFENALESNDDLLARGRYSEQVAGLLRHYPRDRILLLDFDELEADQGAYLRRIYGFLGVAEDGPMPSRGRNAASRSRLRRAANQIGLRRPVNAILSSPVGTGLRNLKDSARRDQPRFPGLSPDTRARLVEYYRPFNEELEEQIGVRFPRWGQ